jgi:hypothetical protein
MITAEQIRTLMTNYKDTTGDVSEDLLLQWVNFINQFTYSYFINVNPESYITNSTIKTIADTDTYALPSDYRESKVSGTGIFKTDTGTAYTALNYDAEVGAFTVGNTVTGGTSGATGVISSINDYGTTGTLTLTGVSGTFQDNENITDTGTGDATVNGSPESFEYDNSQLSYTGFGRNLEGYYIQGDNVVFTPIPNESSVYILRYIPELSDLTAESDETIIPNSYKEFARNATDVFWEQWRERGNMEFLASQRFQSALLQLLNDIKRTPQVFQMTNRRQSYLTRSKRYYNRFN